MGWLFPNQAPQGDRQLVEIKGGVMRARLIVGIGLLCVMALAAGPANAETITYTVDGWGAQHFPGTAADTFTYTPAAPPDVPAGNYSPDGYYWGPDGYPGDQVQLQSYSDSIDLHDGAVYTKQIGTLLWTGFYTYAGDGNASDPNENWQQLAFNFGTPRNITIGTATGSLTQGGLLECNWDDNYISFAAGSTVSLYVPGYRVDITPLPVGRYAAGGWTGPQPDGVVLPSQEIMAQFDVTAIPEPSALILFSMCAISLLAYAWRRQAA